MVVELDDAQGTVLNTRVPDLHREVVARHNKVAIRTKLHVRDGSDQFLEEAPNVALSVLELLAVGLAQGRVAEVAQADDALARGVDEHVALLGVKVGASDHLRQLVHVVRLNVDNTKGLIGDVNIPQVDAQVVGGDEGLPIAVECH